jgi:hypothetical protein
MKGHPTSANLPGRLSAVVSVIILATLPVAVPAFGQITRVEIESVESPALDGRSYGTIGQYERLRTIMHGEVDPDDPRHAEIVNLELAPRNERGRVEYSTVVEIFRPIESSRWNGAIYHTVPNRGGSGAADAALLEMGFAFVRVGWQGDLTPTASNIVAHLPVARHADGSPVTGQAYEEFNFGNDNSTSTATLSYPAASLDPSAATLTVRQNQFDPRATPPDMSWRYDGDSRIVIDRPAGFDGGAIYEFIYEARDPIVMGLGFVAMRDAISFLRHEEADAAGTPNPLAEAGARPEVALSLGISQSGRALRDFLYLGFNEDLEGRMVFDGMHPDIAGSRKTFTNYAFSQPGRWQRQHEDHLFPGDQFPFTYTTLTDPVSGRTDGLLERCSASATCPRIVHTDGEAEIWQARSSLVVTDPAGGHIELPGNVRTYLIAGTQHGGSSGVHVATPSTGTCQFLSNPMALSQIRTALTVALYEWVTEDRLPPDSRFPTVANGGLLSPHQTSFPDIDGGVYTGSYNPLRLNDHRVLPPEQGEAYTVLLPRTDVDGNMRDGVRHPNLVAPIGTHTGWNLRREGFAPGGQCGGTGSFFPFAATLEDRMATGDPRASLQERYGAHAAYVTAVTEAAERLVEERLLLPAHADEIVRLARENGWE